MAFSREQTRRALEQLAAERLSPTAIPDGTHLGNATDAYYETLYRRLVETQPLPTSPRDLAARRNASVVEYLAKTGGPRARLDPQDPHQVQATQDEVRTELQLKAGGG